MNSISSSASSTSIYQNSVAASVKPLSNSSQIREFTRRLPPATIAGVEKKWQKPEMHQLAQTLVKELKENPYKTDIFFHDEIEFIAFYAASENMRPLHKSISVQIRAFCPDPVFSQIAYPQGYVNLQKSRI